MASGFSAPQNSALDWLKRNHAALSADHMTIWNLHEPSWREYKSSAWYMDRLAREGFEVERGTAGMPTAFRARWSNGAGPTFAGYAEYDAVPGQSQAPEPRRKPRDGTSFRAAGHTDPSAAGVNVSRVAGVGYLGQKRFLGRTLGTVYGVLGCGPFTML